MLDIVHGDLWDYHPEYWIVITTNLGWKANGENVMGAGVAKEAALRYPDLPKWYGQECLNHGLHPNPTLGYGGVTIYRPGRMIMMATKDLNPDAPWLSWRANSTLDRIEKSLESLSGLSESVSLFNLQDYYPHGDIYLPPPGCGNGGLALDDVMPLLEKYLGPAPDTFHLVLRD